MTQDSVLPRSEVVRPSGCGEGRCEGRGSATRNRPPPSADSPRPYARAGVPEINDAISHLRDVLGEDTYDALARAGASMAAAAIAPYAFDQIDQVRAQLLPGD